MKAPKKRKPWSAKRKKAHSKTMKAKWADPAWKDAQLNRIKVGWEANPECRAAHFAERKANPDKFTRRDIPNGMTRKQASPLWAAARLKADRFIKHMQNEGILPDVDFTIPDTDEAKGVAALHEATLIALGPGEKQLKLAALRTVLEYCKAKPASRQKIDINTSEDWLAEIAADARK